MATKLTKKITAPIRPNKKGIGKKARLTAKMVTPKNFTPALGRRKVATARVRIFKGTQAILINGQPAADYWPSPAMKVCYQKPFKLTNTLGQYTATAIIKGSGKTGQLDAFVHGVARAFNKLDAEKYRPLLKKHGLLTRDSRMKETRKVGQAGKARFKKQSPKR